MMECTTFRATGASVPNAAPNELRFVTCPIYRDTDAGRKSGCWLADDPATSIRYDVSSAPSKPDWNYAVLVEGIVAATSPLQDTCGGLVLDPVRTSILPERCPRHMLPAEGFRGRPFSLPVRNVAPASVVRPVPPDSSPCRRSASVRTDSRSALREAGRRSGGVAPRDHHR